jgi:hypothetical protein
MNRSQHAPKPLRAFLAWLVVLLQVVGTLHFALVPHAFSATLGGIVHSHGATSVEAPQHRSERAPAVSAGMQACSAELCPAADVPPSSLLGGAALPSGWVSYGAACLLNGAVARSPESPRLFLSAPKTSPPV